MGVADDQMEIRPLGRRDHRIAVGQGQRHRLFDQDMLALRQGVDRLLGMELVRRSDVDRLDVRVGAKL